MATESNRAIYQQDEDGNFVRISANSTASSVANTSSFDPRYLPIESAWALGTNFTTSCDEDGFLVGGIPPVLVDDAITMSVNTGTDSQSRSAFCDEDGNPLDRMPVVSINMINICGGGGQSNEEENRPASRQRISLVNDQISGVSGDIPVSNINDLVVICTLFFKHVC